MSATSATASPTPTETGAGNPGSGGPNSPLLFFVALGFGVVFTNLWIIVGVKYCFRYNQRNRARLAGEDNDGVDMGPMPQRRRRREKKLMTIDEVNDKFPLIKYKTWRANRADQGLPTPGGIAKDATPPEGLVTVSSNIEGDVISEKPEEKKTPVVNEAEKSGAAQKTGFQQNATEYYGSTPNLVTSAGTAVAAPEPTVLRPASQQIDEDEDADQIRMAIPAEQLADMGSDTCAICIDTIEEEDDIRGLTCGHAFHASCVDPWLTSRRACCPLCKADYYVPKPRPEGAASEPRRNEPSQTPFSIITAGRSGYRPGRSRAVLPGVFFAPSGSHAGGSRANRSSRTQGSQPEPQTETIPTQSPEISQPEQPSWRQRMRLPNLPALSRIRAGRANQAGSQPTEPSPTPAQLEAGTR